MQAIVNSHLSSSGRSSDPERMIYLPGTSLVPLIIRVQDQFGYIHRYKKIFAPVSKPHLDSTDHFQDLPLH